MNESELADQFNKELEEVLRSGEGVSFSPDPGTVRLAAAFARADFSGDSAIRESLRERLAGKEAAGFIADLRAMFSTKYLRAALAAVMLVIALVPLARRHAFRAPDPAVYPPVARVPLMPPAAKIDSRLPAALASSAAAPAGGFFAPIPMARLEAEPIKYFPIAPAGAGSPIVLAEGREVKTENGSGIIFETGAGVFTLETRTITPEDIFERRVI